ncbi:pyridoxal phosphate-dependent aminotransferase [Vagococcus sp. JNUCC 83]
MNKDKLKTYYQVPNENLLMEFTDLASKTPNLINLSIGDPDITTPKEIIDAAFKDVLNGHTHYTASDGSDDFLTSVRNFYKDRYGLSFEKNQIRATVGALQGMYLTLQVLLNEGDEVIIHEPYFSPYKTQVIEAGGTPVIIPTYEKDGFQIDPLILEQAVTKNTKAIIINSPNNPTGAVFSKETLTDIAMIAKKNNLFILADEVYEAFTFDSEFTPMASLAPDNTITFSSFSKTFAMTGWRIGYMIAPKYVNDACHLLSEDVTYSAPTPSQRAGIYALDNYEAVSKDVIALFKTRLEYIQKRVDDIPFLSLHALKGSIYTFININQTGLNSIDFSKKLLKEKQILVIPGEAFGKSGTDFIRLAATQDIPVLKEAFDRIEKLTF